MKTISTTLRTLLTTAILGTLASFAAAGPGPQHWKTMGDESDFSKMKPESHAVYVCTMCKSISDMSGKSKEQAMEMCKDGASMTCPACKKTSKVVVKRARNDAPTHTEVTYVDANGKECGFMAMASDKE